MIEELAAQVRDRRRTLLLTQQQLADLAGTGRRAVIDLEAGRGAISLDRAATICSILGLHLEAVAVERRGGR